MSSAGLTPTQAEIDELPAKADLDAAKAKYEELFSEDKVFTEVFKHLIRIN